MPENAALRFRVKAPLTDTGAATGRASCAVWCFRVGPGGTRASLGDVVSAHDLPAPRRGSLA
jgi:hypothetical protein